MMPRAKLPYRRQKCDEKEGSGSTKWWQTNESVEAGGAYSCKLCGDTISLKMGATFAPCSRGSTPTAWFGPKANLGRS